MDIAYSIKTSRRSRSLRVTVHSDGRVIVVKPSWILESAARSFVESRELWIIEKQKEFAKRGRVKLGVGSLAEYRQYKDEALALAKNKIEALNLSYGFKYNRITIRRQKTRWGSCSKKGNLNFNYKIVFLPEDLQEYLIVHELCHLSEFNHGTDFWKLIAKTISDFKRRCTELKKYN